METQKNYNNTNEENPVIQDISIEEMAEQLNKIDDAIASSKNKQSHFSNFADKIIGNKVWNFVFNEANKQCKLSLIKSSEAKKLASQHLADLIDINKDRDRNIEDQKNPDISTERRQSLSQQEAELMKEINSGKEKAKNSINEAYQWQNKVNLDLARLQVILHKRNDSEYYQSVAKILLRSTADKTIVLANNMVKSVLSYFRTEYHDPKKGWQFLQAFKDLIGGIKRVVLWTTTSISNLIKKLFITEEKYPSETFARKANYDNWIPRAIGGPITLFRTIFDDTQMKADRNLAGFGLFSAVALGTYIFTLANSIFFMPAIVSYLVGGAVVYLVTAALAAGMPETELAPAYARA